MRYRKRVLRIDYEDQTVYVVRVSRLRYRVALVGDPDASVRLVGKANAFRYAYKLVGLRCVG